MDNLPYQPLPGRGFGFFHRDRLWLADDHLLSVRSSRFVDLYERFYFGDIQGLHCRDRAGEYLLILISLIVPCLSLLVLGILHHRFWLLPLIPLGTWTVAYAWLGARTECQIQTRLGLHPIPALSHRQAYDNLLQRLSPIITPISNLADTPPAPVAISPPPMEPAPVTHPPHRGYYFEFALVTVMLAGLFSLWNQRALHGLAFDWAEYGLSLAGFVLILMGLACAYRVDVGGGVLASLWGIIVTQAVYGSGLAIAASLQNATPGHGPRYLDHHPIRVLPMLLPYSTALEGFSIAVAIAGLFLIMARKNRQIA